MLRLLRDPRLGWLLAGVLYGYLFLALVVGAIACTTAARPGLSTWSILQPGTTTVYTPCAAVVIEVRQAAADGGYFWRVSIVPRPNTRPPKPEPKTEARLAELRP
jgi:hypothetical protein